MPSSNAAAASLSKPTANLRLRRNLKLRHLIFVGIVIVQPIAPMGVYGIISNKAGGHVATTILLAMVAMLLTAVAYGQMARIYPSAGSAYTYVGQEIHPIAGYIAGLALVMDYILNPLICTILCSKLAQNIVPLPYWVLVIFFAGLLSVMNLVGVKTSARVNEVLTLGMIVVVLIFLGFVLRMLGSMHEYPNGFFVHPFYDRPTFHLNGTLGGTAVAVLTYIGFEGVSTLSEEAENPRRNIALATVIVCALTGILSLLEVYAAQLIWGSKPFPEETVESAFPYVANQIGGHFLFHLLNLTILIANIGSGMASQLAAARLLYGMGRGEALPRKFFGYIDPVHRIPRNNVLLVGLIALCGAFAMRYERGAELLNFGAFIAFMGVNAAAFIHYYCREERHWKQYLPSLMGGVTCGVIWWNLSAAAKLWGSAWLMVGIAYAIWRTRGFRINPMQFEIPAEEA